MAILVASMDVGGAERVALNLANGLSASGVAVDLVLVRRQGELLSEVSPKVRVVDLSASRARFAILPLRRYIKTSSPSTLLAINYEANLAAAAAILWTRPRTRLVLSIHCGPIWYVGGLSNIQRWLFFAASKIFYRQADAVVTVSTGVADELRALNWCAPSQIHTIYNPVIGDDFEKKSTADIDHPCFIDRSEPVVLAVGRLTPAKDYPLLLNAFSKLIQTRPARLVIVGDGECRALLEDQVRRHELTEKVSFLGYSSNPYPLMRSADLFVLSSSYEGFGNVLVEAMAAGTRVVAIDCPHGPAEILEGGRWGILVDSREPSALAAGISAGLDSSARGGGERAQAFSTQVAVSRYVDLFELVHQNSL